MSYKVGLWLDHKRAFIVTIQDKNVSTQTLEMIETPPSRPGQGLRASGGHAPHGVDPDNKRDARLARDRDHFYRDVMKLLAPAEAIHLMGPGQAKQEFQGQLGKNWLLSSIPVELENADRLTDPQIVARVREVFGVQLKRARA